MSEPTYFRKKITADGPVLVPVNEAAVEKLRKIDPSKPVKAKITRARIKKHHKLVMTVLMKMVYPNQDRYDNQKDFLTEVKLRCGWYQEHITANGNIVYIPKSISFEDCPEDDFAEFHERLKVVIPKYFISGVSMEELEDMVRRGEGYENEI